MEDRKAWCATTHEMQRVRHDLVTEQHNHNYLSMNNKQTKHRQNTLTQNEAISFSISLPE